MCVTKGGKKFARLHYVLGSYLYIHVFARTHSSRVDNGSIFFPVFEISNRGVILAGKMPPRDKKTPFPPCRERD